MKWLTSQLKEKQLTSFESLRIKQNFLNFQGNFVGRKKNPNHLLQKSF